MILFLAQMNAQSMSVTEIVWSAFLTSDTVGKIIIGVLFVGSIVAWSISASKAWNVKMRKKDCAKFMRLYEKIQSPLEMGLNLEKLGGPLKNICEKGLSELCSVLGIEDSRRWGFYRSGVIPKKLSHPDIEKIRVSMNGQVNHEVRILEDRMFWLSICVTVAPFLGLFGTVWGVMATFMAIAQTGAAELTAMAPGIAGALLTTVGGLLVAIPSVVANIIINSMQNDICLQMDVFLDDFIARLNRENEEDAQKEEPQR